MFLSCPRCVKFALEMKLRAPSTTAHMAWRLHQGGPGRSERLS
jgi:hypothetical protein